MPQLARPVYRETVAWGYPSPRTDEIKNLLRDPRCSVLISHSTVCPGFLVFEGKAELTHRECRSRRASPGRRPYLHATTKRRSKDWDDYDRIAEADKRVAMVLRPEHGVRPALARMREALAK